MRKKSDSLLMIIILITLYLCSIFMGKLTFAICLSLFAVASLRELLLIRGKDKLPIELELLSYIMVVLFTMNNFSFNIDYYLLDYRLMSALILINLIPLVLLRDKNRYGFKDALYLIGSTMFIGLTYN